MSNGKRLGSFSHSFSDPCVVHVLIGSPLSPCTAMILYVSVGLMHDYGTLDMLYNWIVSPVQLSEAGIWRHMHQYYDCLAHLRILQKTWRLYGDNHCERHESEWTHLNGLRQDLMSVEQLSAA
jgi:hypothetical protein